MIKSMESKWRAFKKKYLPINSREEKVIFFANKGALSIVLVVQAYMFYRSQIMQIRYELNYVDEDRLSINELVI